MTRAREGARDNNMLRASCKIRVEPTKEVGGGEVKGGQGVKRLMGY